MKIISFFSFKGGVGRTALMTNVGAWWARQGKVVLLIDLDLTAPGVSFSPLKGQPLSAKGGGAGMSELLATFYEREPGSLEFSLLPPRLLIKEMELPRDQLLSRDGRLLLIDAGRAQSELSGQLFDVRPPQAKEGDDEFYIASLEPAPSEETIDSRAFRNLARHIREDLEQAKIPPLDPGQPEQSIDYVLIDTRTGIPELIDLSLGYLAEQLVIVSGLNRQHIEGLKQTLSALQKTRVPLDTFPAYVDVVFSPLPFGESKATEQRLQEARKAIRSILRPTRAGLEQPPRTDHGIDYDPQLALEEGLYVLDRPESRYAQQVVAIADALQQQPPAEQPADEQSAAHRVRRVVRGEVTAFVSEPPCEPVPLGPKPAPGTMLTTPWSDLPPWDWPLGAGDRQMDASLRRSERLEQLLRPRPQAGVDERERFLNAVCWSADLTWPQKIQRLESYPTLSRAALELQLSLRADERYGFARQWVEAGSKSWSSFERLFQSQLEWAEIAAPSSKAGLALFLDAPWSGDGAFAAWQSWPLYWLLLARACILHGRPQAGLSEQAIDRARQAKYFRNDRDLADQLLAVFEGETLPATFRRSAERQALDLSRRDPDILLQVAQRRLRQDGDEHNEGVALLQELVCRIQEAPDADLRFCFRVVETIAYRAKELVALAESVWLRVLKQYPKHAGTWHSLGILYHYHLGRYEEAEDAYRKAIDGYHLPNARPWNNLGDLLAAHFGRFDEAEDAYGKAVAIDATFAWPVNGLGHLFAEYRGRYAQAEEAFRKAIEIDSKFAWSYNGLGNLLANYLGRYDEAEVAFRQACQVDPALVWSFNYLAVLYGDCMQRHAAALAACKRGLQIADEKEDNKPYLQMNLGILEMAAGQQTQSVVLLHEAESRSWAMCEALPEPFYKDLFCAMWLALAIGQTSHMEVIRQKAALMQQKRPTLPYLNQTMLLHALFHGEPESVAMFWQRTATALVSHHEHWGLAKMLYGIAGFRPDLQALVRRLMAELVQLPANVTERFRDQPKDAKLWVVYQRFAAGQSRGLGDPDDWPFLFPNQPRPGADGAKGGAPAHD